MSILYAVVWLLAFEAMAWLALPLAARAMPGPLDRALAVARPLGFLLVGYLAWLLPAAGGLTFAAPAVLLGIAVIGAAGHGVGPRHLELAAGISRERRAVLTCTAIFHGVALTFLAIRAFQPEIFWGEKPMDFTFLNHLTRVRNLPTQDPWAAGQVMHYYYLGTYLFAAVLKVLPIPTSFAYNLAVATVPALLASSTYALLRTLTGRRWVAVTGALMVPCLANCEALRLWIFEKKAANFDLFWATSRILRHTMANEYPLWSTLFGDLHAHFIGMPFFALAIALLFVPSTQRYRAPKSLACRLLLTAVCWGALLAVNTWDFITYGVVAAVYFLTRDLPAPRPAPALFQDRLFRELRYRLLEPTLTGAMALLAIAPFLPLLNSGNPNGHGWERHAFNSAEQVARHLAQFLVPVTIFGGTLAVNRALRILRSRQSLKTHLEDIAWFTGIALVPWILALLVPASEKPWSVISLAGWLTAVGGAIIAFSRRHGSKSTGALIAAAGILIAGAEVYWLVDRMNTLFKVYCAVWITLGTAAAAVLSQCLPWFRVCHRWVVPSPKRGLPALPRFSRILALGALGICVVASAVSTVMDVQIMTTFRRVAGPRPTLDGTAYLRGSWEDESPVFDWIRKNVKGVPVLLEAQGDAYGPYTRFAMHTGLPTVLGWEHHVKQRGTRPGDVETRKRDIQEIYSTKMPGDARKLIERYDIRWIVVGELERKKYSAEGLEKFSRSPDQFREAVTHGETTLYEVLPVPRLTASK